MQIKVVFLFALFLSVIFSGFNAHSSNASQREESFGDAKIKPSPTPKQKRQVQKNKTKNLHQSPPILFLNISAKTLYLPCENGNSASDCPVAKDFQIDVSSYVSSDDKFLYTYNVTSGKIIGEGKNVKWALSGVSEGKHTITARVDAGNGLITTQTQDVEVVKCNKCESNKVSTTTPTPIPNRTNNPTGFISPPFMKQKSGQKPDVLPNDSPKLEPTLSASTVYLPCADGKFPEDCPDEEKALIDVSANATDADGDALLYTYNVTGGKVIGDGAKVEWDLSGVKAGKYTVTIHVDDGAGAVTTKTKDIEVFSCKCKSKCPTFSVTVSENTNPDDDVTFTVTLSESVPNAVYRWRVSAGKIIKNEGTYIVVDRKGTGGQVITATLELEGIPDSCPNTASASTNVVKREYAIVEGYINAENKTVQGAKVVLTKLDGGDILLEDITTEKGKFSFRVFKQGTYKIQVFKNGYGLQERTLNVEAGKQIQIPTIILKKR